MESELITVEVILNQPPFTLGNLEIDCNPQPGAYLEFEGQSYLILERSNHYILKSERYELSKVCLYVQKAETVGDKTFFNGRWVMGDPSCVFNAHSELIRCTVNPLGNCGNCIHYQSRED